MKKLFLFAFLFLPIFAVANPHKENVNVLTWWAYLDNPEIVNYVERKCNVKLTFDEYYSNDEFLRRWESHKDYYDVIIFSDAIYNVVENKIPHFANSHLWHHSDNYHPIIRAHYLKRNYPKNVVYFAHSMSGFLWNPANITINTNDTIETIFKKAANKYVVITDDPGEARKLIEFNGDKELSISNFKKMVQQANVYITNNYSQIYNKPEFTFSYGWSGEALVDLLTSNKNYQFLVHPKMSYISSDLLAQVSDQHKSVCVSKALSSEKILGIVQDKGFYFTPYVKNKSVNNSIFSGLYSMFQSALLKNSWLDSSKMQDFQKNNKEWQLIKIELHNINRGI